MDGVKINTAAVEKTAGNLKSINDDMLNATDSLVKAINKMDNNWNGSASVSAITKFNELKSTFTDERYKVVDNYVNFLYDMVGLGYEVTEEVNTKWADAFK